MKMFFTRGNWCTLKECVILTSRFAFLRPFRGSIFDILLPRVPLALHPGLLTAPPTGGRTQFALLNAIVNPMLNAL